MSPTQPNFDLIARPYRWLEYLTLGNALQKCRTRYLSRLLNSRRALVFGDGDGRFLAALMATNLHLHAEAVDSSAAMLHLLRQRVPDAANRLQIHHTSALDFVPSGPYDLVVTHFFLDCLTQSDLEVLVARIAPTLDRGALWLISDFRIPTGPMRLPAQIIIRSLYFSFRVLTGLRTTHLPDYATPLTRAGFVRIAHHYFLGGLLTTELWQIEM